MQAFVHFALLLRWLGVWTFRGLKLLGRILLWALRLVTRRKGRYSRRSGSHGTARFAYAWEILWSGALFGAGPILGKGRFGRLLRFSTDGIVHVFAATGAGKGLGVVIPTLLTYPGSMFVTDPKGENYAITQRRRRTFGPVYMLNPMELAASARFNPLSIVRKDTPDEADDAALLARYMHKPEGKGTHWDDRALELLQAFILHAVHGPAELRTLAQVRTLAVGGPETLRATLQEIAATSPAVKAQEIASGFLTTAGSGQGEDGEFRSILSTMQKSTVVWSRGSPGGIISAESTFSLSDLVTQPGTLYLCVDEDKLEVYAPWLRVMTGCMFTAVLRAKRTPGRRRKLVMLLDEVAALGPLDVLQKNAGLLRAYCTPVLIWQHLLQALDVYGERAGMSLLANATARVMFGTNDNDTADYAARMLGNATVLSKSEGTSQASDAWLRHQQSNNQSEGGYWLLDPAEVQRLPLTRVLIRLRNCRYPIHTRRLNYRWRLRWWGRFDRWLPGAPVIASDGVLKRPSAPAVAPIAVQADAPPPAASAGSPPPAAAAIPPHVRRAPRRGGGAARR